jgi:hypothetical protein
MAIKTDKIMINETEFIITYSDAGFFVERDGILYGEAIDLIEFAEERKYTESAEYIISEATEEDYQEALEELGVTFND